MNQAPSISTKATYPEETKEFWLEHIASMQKSNLSRMAYCRRHNLNYDRMQYWRKKLLGNQAKKLLPVAIKDEPPTNKSAETKSSMLAQLHLGNGVSISITSHDAFTLLLNKVVSHAALL